MPKQRVPSTRTLIRMSLVVVAAALAIPALGLVHPQGIPTHADAVTVAASNFVSPYSTGMAASVVIGQSSFTTHAGGTTPTNITNAQGVAVDAAGDLWVVDTGASRVLEFRAPVYTGEPASIVLGQSNFYSTGPSLSATGMDTPLSLAFTPSGALWVEDWGYCRVLEFVPPFSSGMAASVVIGQASFGTSTCGTSATSLFEPNGIAVNPSGDLFVAEQANNRVTEFVPPFTSGMGASAVLGQSTFTGKTAGTTAVNLSCPLGVAATASMVWVGDSPCGNSRVLGFPEPVSTGEAATVVLGQASFTSTGATGPNITDNPNSMAVDAAGDLFVDDYNLNRIYEFTSPFTTFKAPSLVIGQSVIGGTKPGLSAVNLSAPRGITVAADGTLWVADSGNDRYLGFVPSEFAASFQETGLPAGTAWSVALGSTSQFGGGTEINVPAINGTYGWTVGQAPPDYHLTSALTGTVTVNGSTAVVPVTFAQNSSSSSPNDLTLGLAIGAVVGLVVGIGAGVLIGRRGKGKASTVAPWPGSGGAPPSTPPPSGPVPPPSTGGAPPPGAS